METKMRMALKGRGGGRGSAVLLLGFSCLFTMLWPRPANASTPVALNTNLHVRFLMSTAAASGSPSVRLARDPRDNQLYYSKLNGDIYRVTLAPGEGTSTSTLLYGAAQHGLDSNVQGMGLGPDGTIYLVSDTTTNGGAETFARIVKGVPNANGDRAWSLLAQTEPYPLSNSGFDHLCNGIVASPDGKYVYVNSGARTDHGEVQSNGGLFPDLREAPLTAKILRLPANGAGLVLPNDLAALQAAGYVFAEGTRNTFDLAFAPGGELFGADNGPDRDMSDELNWLRAGLHYGFPWRMGGADNPQQFPNYDPSTDPLLDPRFYAVYRGYYYNDPTFPPAPTNFTEPVVNTGPDADKFKDPTTGTVRDASDLGQTISTFTAHRTPLGLTFDVAGAMAPPFQHHGFMLSFTPGDPNGTNVPGPFFDASQDLVDLQLTSLGGTNFEAQVSRLVEGFTNPVDAEIIGNRLYVLEYSGSQALWEITFPAAAASIRLSAPEKTDSRGFAFLVTGTIPGQIYEFLTSTDLSNWVDLTNVTAITNGIEFTDTTASDFRYRYYRVAQFQ